MPRPIQGAVIMAAIIGVATDADAAPRRYDCDAEAGHFSELTEAQSGPNYALGADISAKRFGRHREWRPGARMAVTSADGRNGIALDLTAPPARARSPRSESVLVSLVTVQDGEKRQFNVTTVSVGEVVHAAIEAKDGVARVEVAGQVAEIPMRLGAGAKVGVSCSTGQFIFEKLDLAAAR